MKSKVYKPECQSCTARFKSVFCELHDDELEYLNSSKGCSSYKKGQVIFSEGTHPLGLFCVNSGKIKLTMLGEEGKEQIIHLAKDGDIMGYRALLSGDTYSCSATALEDTNVCFVPKSVFFLMVEKNSSISMQLMKLLSSELKNAEKNITDLAQKPVRERLAEALLFLKETYGYEQDGATINVVLSREEIANIVGTATESAIRLLSEFKSDNLIELKGKKIKIIDTKRLLRIANISE